MQNQQHPKSDVARLAIEIVANIARRSTAEVAPTMQLRNDLHLMPLHLVLICAEFEEWTNTVVPVEDLVDIRTLEELIRLLERSPSRTKRIATALAVGSSPHHVLPDIEMAATEDEPTWDFVPVAPAPPREQARPH
jgi:acyl carrier protein